MTDIVTSVRQNHALEHATIHLLSRKNPYVHLVGRTTPAGFFIYGEVATGDVASAARDAVVRLQSGEEHLAVHPRCGTNLVVTGVLAGSAAFLAGLGRSRGRLERYPLVLMAATLGALVAQPLAQVVQQRITTTPYVGRAFIAEVARFERGGIVFHKVTVRRE